MIRLGMNVSEIESYATKKLGGPIVSADVTSLDIELLVLKNYGYSINNTVIIYTDDENFDFPTLGGLAVFVCVNGKPPTDEMIDSARNNSMFVLVYASQAMGASIINKDVDVVVYGVTDYEKGVLVYTNSVYFGREIKQLPALPASKARMFKKMLSRLDRDIEKRRRNAAILCADFDIVYDVESVYTKWSMPYDSEVVRVVREMDLDYWAVNQRIFFPVDSTITLKKLKEYHKLAIATRKVNTDVFTQ